MVDLSETKMSDFVNPKDYAELCVPYTLRTFKDLSAKAGLKLSKCKKILDIGVGSGEVTCEIAKQAPNAESILGLDIAPEFLKYANEVKTDKRIEYVLHDVTKPYPEEWGKFDAIISNLTIVRIADQASVIKNIKTALAPGGMVFITIVNSLSGEEADTYLKVNNYEKWRSYIPEEDRQSLKGPKPIWDDIYKYSDFVKSFGFKILDNGQNETIVELGAKTIARRRFYYYQAQYNIPEDRRQEYWDDILNCYPENVGKIDDDFIIKKNLSYIYFESD